ncbi:hypothetical protein A2125_02005 [Candidatus Woesebacteria bacterium GWB1_43_5]|uniref:Uncharacterized protein n=1 Tax=Candidatus Woesebacteria bacterium GWB1_43_5 TaxID=1802474 RepID=A0A1F7WSU5_9BACT|nr:MAG: hypothetical protein A2125_02005 [Candidatus Woesebacteria bacterium GWB1_43_5]
MAKRRTRKQKQTTKHASLRQLYLNPEAEINVVKREFSYKPNAVPAEAKKHKKAVSSPQDSSQKFIKRDIVKSLALASFILSLELVLYLAWK